MKKSSLSNQIEELVPLNSEVQIDKLINLITERNSSIDCYLDKWICSLIESYSLVDYYKKKSAVLKHIEPASDAMLYLAELLVKYYPVNNASKVDALYNEFAKNDFFLSRSDYSFALRWIKGKGKKQWEKLFNKAKEIKPQVDFVNSNIIISVPQPLASLIVTGSVKKVQIENYYKLRKGNTIFVYANGYSSKMMNKIKYDLDIWSNYYNGLFMGCYQDDDFPMNCYVGKFTVGNKFPKGFEEIVNPTVFDSPVKTQFQCVPSNRSILSHQLKKSKVKLSDRTITVPVNEEIWSQLENLEGNAFLFWEEGFDKIINFKNSNEDINEIYDDDDEDDNEIEHLGIAGDDDGLYQILFKNGNRQRLYKQLNKQAVYTDFYSTSAGDVFKALVFDFEKIIPVNDKDSSFDVLQKKEWILDWNCVRFKNELMIVSAPLDGSVRFKTKGVHLPGAMEAYNYLTAYLNDRLAPIHCTIEKMELTIYDTIRLNEAIQKFAAAAKQKGITVSGSKSSNGIKVPEQVSFNQALSKAKQMTAKEFEKYKSKYIDFLVKQQSKKYKVIPCVERLAHTDSDIIEYAFMFSIICKSGDVLIVHENVHPDRSTLLFVVKQKYYIQAIHAIYDFLQSAEINKRSSLRAGNIEIKQAGVEHFRSINHDYFYSWSRTIESYKSFYEKGHEWMIYYCR